MLALKGGSPVRTAPLPMEVPGAHFMGDEEIAAVTAVLRARSPFRYYGLEPQHCTERLEKEWAERYRRKYAVAVNSGTAALHIALSAAAVGPGSEVLLPGYLWTSCLSAIVRTGAIPRLVDIDRTFTMDPVDLERKIGPRTRAILVVNMSGTCGHLDRIAAIAKERGLFLLEDCAQAIGASLHGRPVGSFGDAAIFSFQLNKNITAGEGGMLVMDDDKLHNRCTALHDLGYPRVDGRLNPFDKECMLWGMGARMSEVTAAILQAQLAKLDRIVAAMRGSKWRIRRALEGIAGLEFREVPDPEGDTGPFLITLYKDHETCERFTEALVAEGINGPKGTLVCTTMKNWGFHWYYNNPSALFKTSNEENGFPWSHPANEFARDISYHKGALPVCDDLSLRGALLSISSILSEQDEGDIIAAFRKVADHVL